MSFVKKITFAPLFILLIAVTFYFYKIILDRYLDIYFGSYGGLYEFGLLSIPLLLTGLTYCLFVTFTQDFKYAFGIAVIAVLTLFIFLPANLSLVIACGILISLIVGYFNLQTELKSYVNFLPAKILKNPIKLINTFLLLSLTFGYFLHANSIIQSKGFKIPDSIIDWAIDLSLQGQNIPVKGVKYLAQLPTLTQDQINLLKQNPEVLKQYGLNPADLDQLVPEANSKSMKTPNQNAVQVIPSISGMNLKDIIKAQIADSLDQMIKPYLFAIPFVLAFLFYSLASFCLWIASMFINPIIFLLFYIFEKTGFLKYETEMREVKKIIV